jgi:hypothetical protein
MRELKLPPSSGMVHSECSSIDEKQIPFGNDRKKSKSKSNGVGSESDDFQIRNHLEVA